MRAAEVHVLAISARCALELELEVNFWSATGVEDAQ